MSADMILKFENILSSFHFAMSPEVIGIKDWVKSTDNRFQSVVSWKGLIILLYCVHVRICNNEFHQYVQLECTNKKVGKKMK